MVKISKHFFGATKSPKKRQLILTDFPRLFYVDIDKMAQLGEIEWRPDMQVESRNENIFVINSVPLLLAEVIGSLLKEVPCPCLCCAQGENTYVFETEGRAKQWRKAIVKLLQKANGEEVTEEEESSDEDLDTAELSAVVPEPEHTQFLHHFDPEDHSNKRAKEKREWEEEQKEQKGPRPAEAKTRSGKKREG